jgi:hypothetical protein
MDRRRMAWIFAALLTLLAGGWFLASGLDSQEAEPEAHAVSAGSDGWQAKLVRRAAEISSGYSTSQLWPFAAMRDRPEPMSQRLRRDAAATLGRGHQALGLRFDGAQYVDTTTGIGIWVVRGKGVVCIFHAKTMAAACNTDAEAGDSGLVLVVGDGPIPSPGALPKRFLALGIAPDWTRAVRLQIVDGASKTVPVIDNAFALRARAPINLEKLIR